MLPKLCSKQWARFDKSQLVDMIHMKFEIIVGSGRMNHIISGMTSHGARCV
jgi:hypothetical protein